MAWFQRALGVKIFVAIWLLMLMVPLWRLRATRQWQNPQLVSWGAATGMQNEERAHELVLGLTPRNQANLAHQFPNDAAAQLTALSQVNLGRKDLNSLSNAAMQTASGEYFSRFSALSARFPRDLDIRAQWLRDATQGALLIESEDLRASYHLPAQTVYTPNWMSHAQLEAAIGCARAGAKQEPDNAFWPWMEAIFQFTLRRDEVALQALQRAGKCSRFSDRTLETVRRRIHLMHRVQLTDSEDEFWETWSITFPHYSNLRSAARQAMWRAKSAFDAGDKARALEIAGILQRAGAPVAKSNDSLIARLVGEALSSIAWSGALKNAGIALPDFGHGGFSDYQALRAEINDKFVAYAQRCGRADLANQAQTIATSFSGFRLSEALKNPQFADLSAEQNRLGLLHWVGAWLLQMAVYGALIWLLTLLFSRSDAAPQTRRAMAITSAFCVGATGAILAAAVRLGAVNDFSSGWDLVTPDFNFAVNRGLPFALIAIWVTPIFVWALLQGWKFRRENESGVTRPMRMVHRAMGAGVCGGGLVLFDALRQQPGNTIASQLWPAPLWIFLALWLAACLFWLRRAPRSLWSALILLQMALTGALVWFFSQLGAREGYADVSFNILNDNPTAGVAISALGVSSLVLALRQIDFRSTFQGHFFGDLMTRIRLAAATVAVASSLAYCGVTLVSFPIRAHAQQVLQRYLEIGEPRYIEEQLAQNKR